MFVCRGACVCVCVDGGGGGEREGEEGSEGLNDLEEIRNSKVSSWI